MYAVKHGGYTLTYLIGGMTSAEALKMSKDMYPNLNVRVEETTPEKEGWNVKQVRRNMQLILEGKLQPGPVPD